MNPPARPPPAVLFVHNGLPYESYVKHLTDVGMRVTQVHADGAVAKVSALQPDIVVLDFDSDGDVIEQLKGNASTQHIPVIALVELARRN